jgi:hypothetical protein
VTLLYAKFKVFLKDTVFKAIKCLGADKCKNSIEITEGYI